MSRQTAAPPKIITLRQGLLAATMIALLLFAWGYGRNVLRYRHLQANIAEMDHTISAVAATKNKINRAFDESLSPAVVENFAHEMGWSRPSDEIIVTIGDVENMTAATASAPGAANSGPSTSSEALPNWRLWLNLLTAPR